jgi:hypothetical protein
MPAAHPFLLMAHWHFIRFFYERDLHTPDEIRSGNSFLTEYNSSWRIG